MSRDQDCNLILRHFFIKPILALKCNELYSNINVYNIYTKCKFEIISDIFINTFNVIWKVRQKFVTGIMEKVIFWSKESTTKEPLQTKATLSN